MQAGRPVDDVGHEPGGDEDADDDEADVVEIVVQRGDGVPGAARQAEPVAEQPQPFDAADEQRDDDRDDGDRHVEIDAADRLGQGPVVDAEHQHVVGGVDQRHAGRKQHREHQDRRERHAFRRLRGGDAEHRDLAGGVEAEAEEEADRIHVPAARHQPEHRAAHPGDEAALIEQRVDVLLVDRVALPQAAIGLEDRDEDRDVHRRDREQEEGRGQRPEQAAVMPQGLEAAEQGRRRGDGACGEDDHRRMAHGEEEADRDGPLAALHQLAGDVVDRRDMVGIDGVTQAEAVDDEGNAEQPGLGTERDERPDPGANVQKCERRVDQHEAPAQGRRWGSEALEAERHAGSSRCELQVAASLQGSRRKFDLRADEDRDRFERKGDGRVAVPFV